MSVQQALALPSPATSNTVIINARCSLRIEADQRVIVVAGLPVHRYRAADAVAEAYAMVFLVESGFGAANGSSASVCPIGAQRAAPPTALCAGRHGGARSRRGLASRSAAYLRQASAQHRDTEKSGDQQPGDRAPAGRCSEKAIRKLVGALEARRGIAQLAFAGVMRPPATPVPSAKSTGADADSATLIAQDRTGGGDLNHRAWE